MSIIKLSKVADSYRFVFVCLFVCLLNYAHTLVHTSQQFTFGRLILLKIVFFAAAAAAAFFIFIYSFLILF